MSLEFTPTGNTKRSPLTTESGEGEEIGDNSCDTGVLSLSGVEFSDGETDDCRDSVEVVEFARETAVERHTLADLVVSSSGEAAVSACLSPSSSMTMTAVAAEQDDTAVVDAAVDTPVVPSTGLCGEYIVFKSSRVG